jgi:O-antigen/teichoic acid export membrane protein
MSPRKITHSPSTGESQREPLAGHVATAVFHLVGRFGAITFLSGLATIAITRLLGPTGYGQYAAAVATWSVLGAVADFGFSLMLSRDLPHLRGSQRAMLRSAYEIATAWSALLALVMVGLAFSAGPTSTRGLALLILAPSMVFNGLNPARVFFVVRGRTSTLLRVDVITTALQVAATVLAAALGFGVDVIVATLSVGSIVNNIAIAVVTHRMLEPSVERRMGRRGLIRRSIPLGLLAIMTKVYLTIDLALLGWLVSGPSLGDYAAASKLLTILATVAGVVLTGALPAISSLVGRTGELEQLIHRIWNWLVVGVVPVFVAVALFAPVVVRVLLGTKYAGAVPLLQILCIAGVIGVVNNLVGNLMIAFHKTRALFLQNAAAIALNVTGNLILVPTYGVYASAWLTVASEALVCLMALAVVVREIDLRPCVRASVRPLVAVALAADIAIALGQSTLIAVVVSTVSFLALISVLGAWPPEFRIGTLMADLRRAD